MFKKKERKKKGRIFLGLPHNIKSNQINKHEIKAYYMPTDILIPVEAKIFALRGICNAVGNRQIYVI